MQRRSLIPKVAPLMTALFTLHCGGSEATNPLSVNIGFVGTKPNTAVAKTTGVQLPQGIRLDVARLVHRDFAITADELCQPDPESAEVTCEQNIQENLEGAVVVDLITNESTPASPLLLLRPGTYNSMALSLSTLTEADVTPGTDLDAITANDPLIGRSLRIQGALTNITSFTIEFSGESLFEINLDEDGVMIAESVTSLRGAVKSTGFFVAFDLTQWFEGIELPTGLLGNDTLFINEQTSPDFMAALLTNIKSSIMVFEDKDGNGILDLGEQGTSDAVGSATDAPVQIQSIE